MLTFTYCCRKDKSTKGIPRPLFSLISWFCPSIPRGSKVRGSLSGIEHSAHSGQVPFLSRTSFFICLMDVVALALSLSLRTSKLKATKCFETYEAPEKCEGLLLLSYYYYFAIFLNVIFCFYI